MCKRVHQACHAEIERHVQGQRRILEHEVREALASVVDPEELEAQPFPERHETLTKRNTGDFIEEWLEEMLVELEVGHLFDVSIISGIEGMEKPDPEIYRVALAKAGVDPGYAVHIGDSPSNDVEPARAVGMETVLLDRYNRYPQMSPRVRSLDELPALLKGL